MPKVMSRIKKILPKFNHLAMDSHLIGIEEGFLGLCREEWILYLGSKELRDQPPVSGKTGSTQMGPGFSLNTPSDSPLGQTAAFVLCPANRGPGERKHHEPGRSNSKHNQCDAQTVPHIL